MDKLTSALDKLGVEEAQKNDEDKKELLSLLKEKIRNGNNCTAWYRNLPQIAEDELKDTLETLSLYFEDVAQLRNENDSDLKYVCIPRVTKRCISNRCIQAFINILLKNYEEVLPITIEAYKLIQYCINEKYFSEDYAEGLRYVVRALEIYREMENGSVNSLGLVALQKFLDDLNSFEDLSLKSVVGLLAVKQYFIGNVTRGCYNEQITAIKELIKVDPTNCKWYNCLYSVSSYYRLSVNKYGPPSEEEKAAIEEAIKAPGAEFHPKTLINQMVYLTEVFKNVYNGIIVSPLRFGNNTVYSSEEVINFIRSEADKVLSIDPISVRLNINIAKIFSSILPFQFRDKSFAKICIKRALLFRPNCSKANHRMGVFYLSAGDLPKALKYTRRAYEGDKRNLYSLFDLLMLYMQDISKNKDELTSIFDDALASSFHQNFPRTMSNLLFTSAIHKFLCSKPSQAIELIVEAYTIDEKTTEYFRDIEYNVKRYRWFQNINGNNILGRIHQLLSSAYRQCRDCSKTEKLFKLLEAARDAEQKPRTSCGFHGRGDTRGTRRSSGTGPGSRSRGSFVTGPGSRSPGSSGTGTWYRGSHGTGTWNRGSHGSETWNRGSHGTGAGSRGRGSAGGFGDHRGNRSGTSSDDRSQSEGNKDDKKNERNFGTGTGAGSRGSYGTGTENRGSHGTETGNRSRVSGCGFGDHRGNKTGANSGVRSKSEQGRKNDKNKENNVQSEPLNDYAVLGVAETATKGEVKQAYHKLALLHHPGKNSALSEAEKLVKQELMKQINKAWESLQVKLSTSR